MREEQYLGDPWIRSENTTLTRGEKILIEDLNKNCDIHKLISNYSEVAFSNDEKKVCVYLNYMQQD